MTTNSKQAWFQQGQEDATSGKPNLYVNPTSWQARAYCSGYASIQPGVTAPPQFENKAWELGSDATRPSRASKEDTLAVLPEVRIGKSTYDSILMLKRFVIPDSWPTGAKAHALQLMAVDPMAPPRKIARHQRAIQRLCKRWGRPMNPELLAVVDELSQ